MKYFHRLFSSGSKIACVVSPLLSSPVHRLGVKELITVFFFERADQSTVYKYIDCFNGGRLLSEGQCIDLILPPSLDNSSLRKSAFIKATPKQVIDTLTIEILTQLPDCWIDCWYSSKDQSVFLQRLRLKTVPCRGS